MLPVRVFLLFSLVSAATLFSCAQNAGQNTLQLASPNGQIVFTLTAGITAQPALRYSVDFRGKRLIEESELGLDLQGAAPLGPAMFKVGATLGSVDKSYTIPAGKTKDVRDHYNSLTVDFQSEPGVKFSSRYEPSMTVWPSATSCPSKPTSARPASPGAHPVPLQQGCDCLPAHREGFQSSYEDDYIVKPVSGLHHDWLVALPLLAELPGTGWVAITEADIDNYAGMYLRSDKPVFTLKAELSPRVDQTGVAVVTETPFKTPWRVLMIGDIPGRLIESNIILNLNPPSKIDDTSWINREKLPGTGGRATTLRA